MFGAPAGKVAGAVALQARFTDVANVEPPPVGDTGPVCLRALFESLNGCSHNPPGLIRHQVSDPPAL